MADETRIKVLGIVGSPRRGGNTDVMVDHVLKGAEEAGAVSEKVLLSRLDIGPCLHCETCHRERRCAQEDDMIPLMEKMSESQVWVLGTPVYWWGPSAQLKTFIDRWYGAYRIYPFEGKRAVLVTPFGDSDADTARFLVGMVQASVDFLEVELAAVVKAAGMNDRGDVLNQPTVLAAARKAGRDAALASRA